MNQSIFTCDKCGVSETYEGNMPKNLQPVAIGLYINFLSFNATRRTHQMPDAQQVWCRTCAMKHGITEPHSDEDKKVAPVEPKSSTDVLVELLESLGFQRTE